MTATPSPRRLHVGITEQGKLDALAGEHQAALAHYREAMAVAVRAGEPEVFFRHSLECALESLELLGAFDEVLAYCERAIAHYHQRPPENAVATRDLAHVHQRRAVVLLKRGEREAARADLATCLRLQPGGMPLAACLQRWLAGPGCTSTSPASSPSNTAIKPSASAATPWRQSARSHCRRVRPACPPIRRGVPMLDNRVMHMTPGEALMEVPVGDFIQRLGMGIAEAQLGPSLRCRC